MPVSGKDFDRWRLLMAHIDMSAVKLAQRLSEEALLAIAGARASRQPGERVQRGAGPADPRLNLGHGGEWPDTEPAWRTGDR